MRVAWHVPHLRRGRGLRLRDLALGDPRLPGRLRASLILRRDRQRAQCLVGASATIDELRKRFERQVATTSHGDRRAFAGFVARQAALALDAEERGIQGSRYKVPRFVADSIVASHDFQPAIERIAAESARPVPDVLAQSRAYLAELVATPSALFLDLRAHLDRFIFTRGYDRELRCERGDLERLRQQMRDHPTVLLFTHKSYVDASLPGLLLYENDLPMLHTFGGINLDIAGFGTLMRRSGGIFIRRAFHDDPVYKLVLRRYVAYLLEKRFPMSWALEGTRSRLGKLMPPRYGLLKYTLDAAHDAGVEDLHIVPFVTSFDQIRDVEEYAAEQSGRAKRPESFGWLLGYVTSRRRPMGRLRVDLGEPVVVGRAPDPGDRRALERIAFEAALQANRVTPLTVTAVICLVVLGTAPRGVTARGARQARRGPRRLGSRARHSHDRRTRGRRSRRHLRPRRPPGWQRNAAALRRWQHRGLRNRAVEAPDRQLLPQYDRPPFPAQGDHRTGAGQGVGRAGRQGRGNFLDRSGSAPRTPQVRVLLSGPRTVPR